MLIKPKSAEKEKVVDDLLAKCMDRTMQNIADDAAIYAILFDGDGPSALEVTSAVAIGIVGSVLSHPDCDDNLERRVLAFLMDTLNEAQRRRRQR